MIFLLSLFFSYPRDLLTYLFRLPWWDKLHCIPPCLVLGMTMQHALSKLACTALGMTSFKLRSPLILVLSHL